MEDIFSQREVISCSIPICIEDLLSAKFHKHTVSHLNDLNWPSSVSVLEELDFLWGALKCQSYAKNNNLLKLCKYIFGDPSKSREGVPNNSGRSVAIRDLNGRSGVLIWILFRSYGTRIKEKSVKIKSFWKKIDFWLFFGYILFFKSTNFNFSC